MEKQSTPIHDMIELIDLAIMEAKHDWEKAHENAEDIQWTIQNNIAVLSKIKEIAESKIPIERELIENTFNKGAFAGRNLTGESEHEYFNDNFKQK